MVQAQVYTVAKIFDGEIKESDFSLVTEDLASLEDGEYLVESLYLSVDPYMRLHAQNYTIGQVMIGIQVAKVIETKNPSIPIGQIIVGNLGWRTRTIIKPSHPYDVYVLPDIGPLPTSLALGVLGATGISAYFGFLEMCKPVEGETVVVSGAGGAVGSHVGQIAKIKGCRVVGITGSEQKKRWLEKIGFDYVINYKTTTNLSEELQTAAPNGVDCYFDNVGGDMSTLIMLQMNIGGRVSVCGSISSYNSQVPVQALIVQPTIVRKQLTLEGFIRRQFKDRWMEAIKQNLEWVQENKIIYYETITEGFENAPLALIGVMRGENTGKAVVRVKSSEVEVDSMDFNGILSKFKKIQARS